MSLPRFGVTKPVPVNLLMIALIVAGIVSLITITREFFPEMTPDMASIALPYPGATPEEVEEGLALKVEDAIAELDEIKTLRTTLTEGGGGIMIEFRGGVNVAKATDKVERTVNSLQDLPDDADRLTVVEFEPRLPVIMLSLYGDAGERALKEGIQRLRDELKTLPGMGQIVISGTRDYEIRIDIDNRALLEHGISLTQVTSIIRAWMREVPGGTIRTETGPVSMRTLGTPERAEAIREIVIKSDGAGQALRVGDIAVVREDFTDVQSYFRYNGAPAASLTVFKVGSQDAVEMAKMVRAYVAGRHGEPFTPDLQDRIGQSNRRAAWELGATSRDPLPGTLSAHSDLARFIEGRLELLSRNAFWGAVLVFTLLLFFLNWRVALWVGSGLVVSICGTLLLMQFTGVSLNLLTMFGLIIVLGLLVDDAIIVAENVQHRHDQKEPALIAAIRGTEEVFWPVVVTVTTSIVAFLPLGFIEGRIGDMLGSLPMVVVCALTVSLVETLLILPSHMGHSLKQRDRRQGRGLARLVQRFEAGRDRFLFEWVVPRFGDVLNLLLRFRYISIAVAIATFIGTLGMVAGGRVTFTFLGESDSETIVIDVRMPIGVAIGETEQLVRVIEQAAADQPDVLSIAAVVGQRQNTDMGTTDVASTHVAQLFIELVPVEERDRESRQVIDAIRQAVSGRAAAADSIKYSEISGGPGGADITLEVTGERMEAVGAAAEAIQTALRRIDGVFDVSDDNYEGQREVQIRLRPHAAALGLTIADVATQVRGALFGLEAHVFSALREDIKVRVRLDEATRRNLYEMENLWVITPAGNPVPLTEVADIREGTGYATIKRLDRRRVVTVTADTSRERSPEQVMAEFAPTLAEIREAHPSVRIQPAGRQQNLNEALASLPYGFMAALLMIYILLAWLFNSVTQPLVVMTAIPFGIIGVIWGHWLLGYEITFLSLIGFIALSGIVVNGSLILVDYYNRERELGKPVREALVEAGKRRLRPIFLTTITTVCGLTPLMLERSFQAQFLIPMAIAIAFGLISATVLILMVLPCMLVVLDDLKGVGHYLWFGERRPPAEAKPAAVAELSD